MYILFVGLATLETHLEGSHLYFEIPWIFLAWLVLLSHSWFCAISLFQNAADRRCPAQVLISLIPARWFGELLKTYSCLHRGCHAQRVPWPAGLEGGPGLDKQLGQGPNSCLAGGCGQWQKTWRSMGPHILDHPQPVTLQCQTWHAGKYPIYFDDRRRELFHELQEAPSPPQSFRPPEGKKIYKRLIVRSFQN